ncbi:LuxR C-terminal-related transcriptional regulator [Antrihabitans sp. YC2-6]|uniref:ATP-binding protein n=1 Tax=Antrihabitans sp. YC2-6 TaxID=2799498 RepID=UPI001F3B30F3|nr:LuxR C-terminal-related transcriptional regulator [Antrihabitans sp. YC2-6]
MAESDPDRPRRHAVITSFVGRRRELADAKSAMGESRLVTLTGPGGVGKTRLAYELAERARRAFRDGTWIVELASVEDESSLTSAVVSTLAVPDQSNRAPIRKLTDYLRERQLLIVLDNCEHMLAPVAALVDELLAHAPGLRILATSREPLGIAGEHSCTVPPLTTPPPDIVHSPESIDRFEAVRLFIDRARDITPDFAVTQENSVAVVQLCNRLDGIPLAIELATTRLRALSVTQIVARLDRRFQLLTGGNRVALPRQQTLRALIDWSYELCTDAEKLLWARLSVFTGSLDLDAAEQVCGFGELNRDDVIDVLDRLVAKSILVIDRDGETVRFRQLMTVREYGAELLAESGERSTVRTRHRDHYRNNAKQMVAQWCGRGQATALAAMKRDHPNLMSALEWSVTTPGELGAGAELAVDLRYHWIAGGFLSDGRRVLEQVLDALREPGPHRGEALWVAAWVALIQGDRDPAQHWLVECSDFARARGDGRLASHSAQWIAIHHLFSGDTAAAIVSFEQAIAGFVSVGDRASELTTAFQLAMAQTYNGRHDDALGTCRSALALSQKDGELWAYAYTLWISGVARWHLADAAGAEKDARAALAVQRSFKDSICVALTIELLSWIEASRNFDRAADLYGAAQAVWTGLGTTVEAFGPDIHRDSSASAALVVKALGRKRVDDTIAKHADLTKDAALDLALDVHAAAARPDARPVLTKREQEIAELIAKGMSNRAVAEALVISPRTVDGHVERVLAKLDFTSRTQIASWIAGNPSRS